MEKVEIIQLTDSNSGYFPLICGWMYNWWGTSEGWSYEKVKAFLGHTLNRDSIPQTFLAISGGKAVGMYQFSMFDLDVRPDLYPWIMNVYVDEAYRRMGISRLLMLDAVRRAGQLGYERIYLYTHHAGLYEKYGFKLMEEMETFKGKGFPERIYVMDGLDGKIRAGQT